MTESDKHALACGKLVVDFATANTTDEALQLYKVNYREAILNAKKEYLEEIDSLPTKSDFDSTIKDSEESILDLLQEQCILANSLRRSSKSNITLFKEYDHQGGIFTFINFPIYLIHDPARYLDDNCIYKLDNKEIKEFLSTDVAENEKDALVLIEKISRYLEIDESIRTYKPHIEPDIIARLLPLMNHSVYVRELHRSIENQQASLKKLLRETTRIKGQVNLRNLFHNDRLFEILTENEEVSSRCCISTSWGLTEVSEVLVFDPPIFICLHTFLNNSKARMRLRVCRWCSKLFIYTSKRPQHFCKNSCRSSYSRKYSQI